MSNVALFRDFKLANDVGKMHELRMFQSEYTLYGSVFFNKEGKVNYIVSSEKNKLVDYILDKKYYHTYPLPIMSETVRLDVPAGNEDDIVQQIKFNHAKKLRDTYDEAFLKDFYALATTENDNAAWPILHELQEKMRGLYRKENHIAFEGLMDVAIQKKHLTKDAIQVYEKWLEAEWRQMEDDSLSDSFLGDRFFKELYGLCYVENGSIKAYCNGVKESAFDKKQELEAKGLLVSQIYQRTYWYGADKSLADIRKAFNVYLEKLFDATYFDYMARLCQLNPAISEESLQKLQEKYKDANAETQKATAYYARRWQ